MKLKQKLALTLSALLLSSDLALPASAMKAVGNVNVPYGTPKIDGTIDAAEWKSAGTVKDDAVTCSTEGKYDKDTFQLSIDLGQPFYGSNESRAIFYSFGCYEDGTGMLQRQESKNDAVVMDGEQGLSAKTKKTAAGWNFELAIPFSMLKEDGQIKSGKDIAVAAGTKINVMACYINYDAAGTMVSAFGTTLTDESVAYDWGPKDHGITLTLETKQADTTAAPATADPIILTVLAAMASGAALAVSKKRK